MTFDTRAGSKTWRSSPMHARVRFPTLWRQT